jgi:hypothetical protein
MAGLAGGPVGPVMPQLTARCESPFAGRRNGGPSDFLAAAESVGPFFYGTGRLASSPTLSAAPAVIGSP